MNQAESLQERIDALRRKCSTGYGCGSTCISLRKECRTSPSSSISKQRLKRLLEIAAGSPSKQRGIAPVKPKEAGEMAGAITVQRGEKAGQLRGVRQQAAAEKAKAAEAATKAAAQASQPRPSNGDRPMAPAGTPRGEADRAAKAADPDYEFARPSAVGNVGEDLKDSARHKANQWRTLAEAEADGTAAALVTRDKLLKAEPLDLTEGLTSANYLTRLAGHLALKSFPVQPFTDKAFSAYERSQITGKKSPAEMRKLYYDHLQEVKGIIDRRRDDADPRQMLEEISRATVNRIAAIRGDRSQPNADRFNPLANSLVDLTKKVSRGSYSKTSVTGQINTLGVRLKRANETKSTAELAEIMRNATDDILKGASIDKVTGVNKGGTTFNPADLYVKKAVRTGGRSLGVDDSPAGSATVLAQRMGMRGLQFGNSVTDDERAHHLRKTAEAMVDLADVTGLPDRAMSLDGQLGLAFGARGKGRASAHYEPGTKVINITRKNGVGTLAHEWGHALDDYIGQRSPRSIDGGYGRDTFMSEQISATYVDRINHDRKSQADDPVWKAMDGVRKAIDATDFPQTMRQGLRDLGIKPGRGSAWNYWTSNLEVFARTFERYVQHKLQSKGQENTYLSGLGGNSPLWPTKDQIAKMAPAFDELMRAVRANTFGSMKSRADSREQRIRHMIQGLTSSGNQPPQSENDGSHEIGLPLLSKGEPMHLSQSLQMRIDALQRKCTTGYGCGSACISLRKECRTSPRDTIGKVRLKRLLDLAAEGGSSQRGINQVKPNEAAELAKDISAQRGERAAQLRNARQQANAGQQSPAKPQPAETPTPPAEQAKPERGGALAVRPQPQEEQRSGSGASTPDEKYAGKGDDASVTAYAKEKAKQLLSDPKAWENTAYVQKQTKDDRFGHAVLVGDDATARRAFNSYFKGVLATRKRELERGHSFFTDKPEDIEKRLEKAKVSKSKNKEKTIKYLTKKLEESKRELEAARVFVEETFPRMNKMSDDEKVAYARNRARKNVDSVIQAAMKDLKSEARGGKEVDAVADFLRIEQGGVRKGVAELIGEESADDMDVIRAQLTGKGTSEGALGLQPGIKPSRDELKSAYRKAAAKSHPDAGGSAEEFRMTQQAYERLKKKYKYDSLKARLDALRARCG